VSQLVEFTGEGGAPILIQVTPPYEEIEPAGRLEDAIDRLQGSFRGALGMVRQLADDFSATLSETEVESAEIEFGLQFTGKGRLCVVEGQAQASLKVKLKIVPRAATE
jgi:NTP-dependent ternary system trypsin peptidase co-occuring protein